MLHSRKFVLTLIGVGLVLILAIGSAVLKKYADIDIAEIVKWAMVTIAAAVGMGNGTIAYEDAKKAQAGAA